MPDNEHIGFERVEQIETEDTGQDVEDFQELYNEIVDCRRAIDKLRAAMVAGKRPSSEDVWVSYRELAAVLQSFGIATPTFPDYEEHGPMWNYELLHSLYLREMAIFARLGDIESARQYCDSDQWKKLFDEYIYGPPVDEARLDERRVFSTLLAAIVAMVRRFNQIDYADPQEFAVAVQHVAMRTTGLSREEQDKLREWTEALRKLCS